MLKDTKKSTKFAIFDLKFYLSVDRGRVQSDREHCKLIIRKTIQAVLYTKLMKCLSVFL